jgi:uncharacterized protein YkwD
MWMHPANLLAALCVLTLGACAGSDAARRSDEKKSAVAEDWPAWAKMPQGVAGDKILTAAARALCLRATDGVIDDALRMRTGMVDAQVQGSVLFSPGKGVPPAPSEKNAHLLQVTESIGATHVGAASVKVGDRNCTGVVAAARKLTFSAPLPTFLPSPSGFLVAGKIATPFSSALFYLRHPDGSVDRKVLPLQGGRQFQMVIDSVNQAGSYLLEIVVDSDQDDPQIAAWWPFDVAHPNLPPFPELVEESPEDSERALALRLGSLLARLRAQQDLDDLFIAPPLEKVAQQRASALALEQNLGHRLPDGRSPGEAMRAAHPQWAFSSLSEVQAQGRSLAEAWSILLQSPAHRYELVEPHLTHTGGSVARGVDALGNDQVSVVLLVARRINPRPAKILGPLLRDGLNLARIQKKRPGLKGDPVLDALAHEAAERMAAQGRLDAVDDVELSNALVERSENVSWVRVVVARLDDPLRLGPSDATLDARARWMGLGLVRSTVDGPWYVCVVSGAAN